MGNVENFDGHVRNTQNRFARNGWKSETGVTGSNDSPPPPFHDPPPPPEMTEMTRLK